MDMKCLLKHGRGVCDIQSMDRTQHQMPIAGNKCLKHIFKSRFLVPTQTLLMFFTKVATRDHVLKMCSRRLFPAIGV